MNKFSKHADSGCRQSPGGEVARLLHFAWREVTVQSPAAQVQSPSEAQLTEIAPLLCHSGAAAFAWRKVHDTPLAVTAAGRELHEAYRRFRLSALIHEREIIEVLSPLRAEGIEAVLVKGWSIARRYPDRALRPYGDIDLCVAPAQFAKATAVLKCIESNEGPLVDLHSGFASIGVDARRARMLNFFSARNRPSKANAADDNDWDELYARSQVVKLGTGLQPDAGGFPVRTLSDEDHLRLLCLHLLRSGARRPAWLCDVALLVEQASRLKSEFSAPHTEGQKPRSRFQSAKFDWSVCLGHNPVHADWVGVAIGLAHELLGADIDQTPFREKQLPGWLVPAVLKQWSGPGATRSWTLNRGFRLPVLRAAYSRWDNPIRSVAAVGGQFNDRSRLRYRVAELLARCAEVPEHSRKLWREFARGQKTTGRGEKSGIGSQSEIRSALLTADY